ncbi:V/A-type H+-transporting ATPase subunit B [Catenibacillus scindens]|uniref:V-type ATP synthase beta chain n=1 Tax=Catenibacillus scindens TaxID=673271 RepID=A0A7W8M5T5_9FIRM|nr:V-type ATP synthase subunit B [Catenibacillus scindens]MBB5264701.1 V/A-type H+-transporting ATPase subunit B [Catenibacillus scindens]
MSIEYLGLTSINGPLVILEGVMNASFEEIVEMKVDGTETKLGRIIQLDEDRAVIQVFENTANMSLSNTRTKLTGHPMEITLSEEILGRTFNGLGQPIDGLGEIVSDIRRDVNGKPMNPVRREYPRNYIRTGISAIDGLTTLIRGQKLPIFSGNGLPHDQLAAQIVKQASLSSGDDQRDSSPDSAGSADSADSQISGEYSDRRDNEQFAVVFAAMGVKHDVAEFFRRTFEESGAASHVVTYLNLANDPVAERIITPKVALTAAEYLAFDKGYHVLVILTDMTSYAEALREISSSKGEIPSRKGYPGYLYSELATIYERAGIIAGCKGSVTQIPILTMPGDDITHPIPDLTGYITEGQIVLDRSLHQQGIYPPINVLPSLSRLMKDGIGEGFTREDHQDVANQLFSAYAKVGEARALASVIGEDELSPVDKQYLSFGKAFENEFIGQDIFENRSIIQTLDIGWKLLRMLPKDELDRIDTKLLDKYYDDTRVK